MEGFAGQLISNGLTAGMVLIVCWFFMKKYMERLEQAPEKLSAALEARLLTLFSKLETRQDRIEQEAKACSMNFVSLFRTKADSEMAWTEQQRTEERMWNEMAAIREKINTELTSLQGRYSEKLSELQADMARVEARCEAQHKPTQGR